MAAPQRLGLEERTSEELNPPEDARVCSCCGQPYGRRTAPRNPPSLRSRSVPTHAGSSVPAGAGAVTARPRPWKCRRLAVPRLFDNTLYGISVWACFLFERNGCFRPLNRVGAWLSNRGLLISPGTLADSVPRFVPLFENTAGRCDPRAREQVGSRAMPTRPHGSRPGASRDRPFEPGLSLDRRSCSDAVYFHIDPSRSGRGGGEGGSPRPSSTRSSSATAGERLQEAGAPARRPGDPRVVPWSHMRRDCDQLREPEQERLTEWCQRWIARIEIDLPPERACGWLITIPAQLRQDADVRRERAAARAEGGA